MHVHIYVYFWAMFWLTLEVNFFDLFAPEVYTLEVYMH